MLTPHQEKALDPLRHLSITANAGSGKTRVLVERYLAVLLGGLAEVGEIVALTYTEKAAGELKRRIAERVSAALASASDPPAIRRLEQIREQLPGAFIGTIHSFCSRLLREHPVEAGVDAAFGIIEGLDQYLMLNESMNDAFRAILSQTAGIREGLVDAVRRMGKASTVEVVRELVQKRERLDRLTGPGGVYRQSDEEILGAWRTTIVEHIVSRLLAPATLRDFDRVLRAVDGKDSAAVRDAGAEFLNGGDRPERVRAGWQLLQRLLKKDGGLYRSVASANAENSVAEEVVRLARLRKSLVPLVPLLDGPEAETDQHLLLRLTRTLLEVAQQVNEVYELRKSDAGKLDFEDLQLRAKGLLRREPVRRQLSARFKFIMVDEYQDTNQLQYDILRPLLTDLASGNLCIVGDPKQSIYGFRDADVEVFETTRSDIVRAVGADSDIVLGESFRPLRDLAGFVNMIFEPLMKGESGDPTRGSRSYEVQYEPLVRSRTNLAAGRVELLFGDGNAEETAAEEADRIARRLLGCVQSGQQVFGADETPRPVRYSDIGLLLRSRTHLPEIEAAFARIGVPYMVTGGIGYFQTQDVLDCFNYLQFLDNPSDDIALAGVLRSPFFSLSDTELFEFAAGGRKRSLWEDLRSRADLPERLDRAVAALADDLVLCPRMPVAEVLPTIIRKRLYVPKILGTSRGVQGVANLEKLQRLARSYDLQGFATLHDFTRRLRSLIDEENNEGQGNIEAQTDAVQVLTVHAAKGLEFPVVVLPFLVQKFPPERPPFVHPRIGIGFDFTRDDGTDAAPPISGVLREEAVAKTLAEEKRILYVACTRARDMLILSGRQTSRGDGGSALQFLIGSMLWDPADARPEIARTCALKTLEARAGEFSLEEESFNLRVHILRTSQLPAVKAPPPGEEAGATLPSVQIAPLFSRGKGEIFSATRIKTYRECPALYYIKYVLGLSAGFEAAGIEESAETADSEYPGELRGRVFHGVMQRIDTTAREPGALDAAVRRLCAAEGVTEGSEADRLAAEVVSGVLSVLDSDLWREAGGGAEVRTEFTISTVLGDDFLSGTIDRMYRDATGLWNVLDYKTDRVEGEGLLRRADTYWPQLKFYALLVQRYHDVPRVQATLLFTSAPSRPLRQTFTADDLSRFEDEIRMTIGRIKAGDFHPMQSECPGCPMMPEGCRSFFP